MNPEKLAQLKALLAALPPGKAGALASAVERDRLAGGKAFPHDDMLEALRPHLAAARAARIPSALRVFCAPFEDVLSDHQGRTARTGLIRRNHVREIWNWINEQLIPLDAITLTGALRTALLEGGNAASEARAMRARMGAAIVEALGDDISDPDALKKRARYLSSGDIAVEAVMMARFIAIEEAVFAMQAAVPPGARPSPALAASLKPVFGRDDMRDDARTQTLLFALMGRMAEPAQLLALTGQVSERFDAMMKPAFAGSRLTGDLADAAAAVRRQRSINLDGEALVADFTRFAQGVIAIEKALGLRMDRTWELALNNQRATMAEPIENFLERVPRDINAALPVQRLGQFGPRGPRRPDLSRAPDPQKSERGLRAARIAAGILPLAAAGAVAAVCQAVVEEAGNAIRLYVDDIIADIRASEGEEHARASAFAGLAVTLGTALLGPEEGDILSRRVAAAHAAHAA